MTKEQVRKNVERVLFEHFDSFILVGKVAGSTQMVLSAKADTPAERSHIMVGVQNLATSDIFQQGDPE